MKVHLSGVLLLGSIAFMHAQYDKNVGINIPTPTATLHLKGKGSDNTTQSLKIENSVGTNLLTVNDDGTASGSVLAGLGGGSNGKNALVRTTQESAGSNCANGGIKVETGLDTNGNGTLDASEITDTRYVCNGSNGQGLSNGSAGGQVYLTSATSPYSVQAPKTMTGDISITDNGATTIAASAVTTAKLANQSVTVGKISATGTPGSSTFLRGDGSWAAAGGSGGGSSAIPFKKITMTTGNNNYTVTTADLGGILLFDWAAIQGNNTGTINLTLPSPATAGSGVKFKISYTSFQGGTNWACNARTPSGSMYAGNSVAPANTYISVYFTSEFFCDGTNWYEIPES
ncbi:DUF7151 family protein [Chryseobacterium camelliae]|uniref:DUF7151 family protein n=1 Tax=Chryseobacterium camelliae TaxID=1265445 RepID=UPI0028668985|nr:hypothetical protein [Chryseobacterium camelliae]MDR6515331.1 hypothetical protein [Chryseobacterium camelliae]